MQKFITVSATTGSGEPVIISRHKFSPRGFYNAVLSCESEKEQNRTSGTPRKISLIVSNGMSAVDYANDRFLLGTVHSLREFAIAEKRSINNELKNVFENIQ